MLFYTLKLYVWFYCTAICYWLLWCWLHCSVYLWSWCECSVVYRHCAKCKLVICAPLMLGVQYYSWISQSLACFGLIYGVLFELRILFDFCGLRQIRVLCCQLYFVHSLVVNVAFWPQLCVFWAVYHGHFLCCISLCLYEFCLLLVLVRLSVPVQVIDWKDSSPKWPVMCWWGCKTYSFAELIVHPSNCI